MWYSHHMTKLSDLSTAQLEELADRADTSLKMLQHYASGRRRVSAARAGELERAAKRMKLELRCEDVCAACKGCELAKKARKLLWTFSLLTHGASPQWCCTVPITWSARRCARLSRWCSWRGTCGERDDPLAAGCGLLRLPRGTDGAVVPGVVDTRSIEDVRPSDLHGFTQCHFFAGIGVWSYALRAAGWPHDRPVWTGSCPCQPFSAAGQGAGFADERHLWPAWHHLIEFCEPPVVFGEQVASKAAEPWLDLVQDDMEALGYAFGAVPFPAASIGAPHIRDRLYWVAHSSSSTGLEVAGLEPARQEQPAAERGGAACELADADGRHAGAKRQQCSRQHGQQPQDGGACIVGHAELHNRAGRPSETHGDRPQQLAGPSATRGFWSDAEWIPCRDGKWRPVEPSTFPLAHGAPARVGRLRAYGNAIVAPQAVEFIRAAAGSLVGVLHG